MNRTNKTNLISNGTEKKTAWISNGISTSFSSSGGIVGFLQPSRELSSSSRRVLLLLRSLRPYATHRGLWWLVIIDPTKSSRRWCKNGRVAACVRCAVSSLNFTVSNVWEFWPRILGMDGWMDLPTKLQCERRASERVSVSPMIIL